MNTKQLETILAFIRSLIALSLGMVVALLALALAFWLQSEEWIPASDPVSIVAFLLSVLLGGLATGLVSARSTATVAVGHGLGFVLIYLLMFYPAIQDVGPGVAAGLAGGGLLLGAVAAWAGFQLRRLHRSRNER